MQVAERSSFMEEVKLERERQQKVCSETDRQETRPSCSGAKNKAMAHGTGYSCAGG
jgi:hypothetical protein